jgi:hypothetical protein
MAFLSVFTNIFFHASSSADLGTWGPVVAGTQKLCDKLSSVRPAHAEARKYSKATDEWKCTIKEMKWRRGQC